MKKIGVIAILTLLVLMLGASAAMAGHGKDHPTPRCGAGDTTGKGSNKQCYPPPRHGPGGQGKPSSFTTDAPQQSGITVGMATVIALAGVGTLLVVRRRWVFRTNGR